MAFVPKTSVLSTSASKVADSVKFDASTKTIQVNDKNFGEIIFAVNVTDGIVIFDPATASKTGTRKDRTVNLVFDTTTMSDSDDILVIYEPLIEDQAIISTTDRLLTNILDSLGELRIQMSLITGYGVNEDI